MKRLPFLANSDFHKPKHIYSWKTLLHCEKDTEAIKECIRKNEHVSITLFRENNLSAARANSHRIPNGIAPVVELPPNIPLAAARDRF
jgi:hypothetical protein